MMLKKGTQVKIITGKDKGKTGEILEINLRQRRIKVKSINMVKRHTRPTQTSAGGIIEKEASIHISNVAHLDPEKGKPTRVKFEVKDGFKRRLSVVSGSYLDK